MRATHVWVSVAFVVTTACSARGETIALTRAAEIGVEAAGPSLRPSIHTPTPTDTAPYPGFVAGDPEPANGPTTITRRILQVSNGDLWLATFSGVIRYDGTRYSNVTYQAGLERARAFALLEDKAGNIWIGTLGAGAYRYDGATFDRFTAKDGLAGDRVLSIAQDRTGNMWFGFEGAGATRYDGTAFRTFARSDGFTDGDVSSIAQDAAGRMWFGTRAGLFHYDGKQFVNFSTESSLPIGGYIPTLIDNRGQLWFGGQAGLHHYDGTSLRRVATEPSWALLEQDAAGNIWFTGKTSLNRVKAVPQAGAAEPKVVRVAPMDGMLFDILEDNSGQIWVGTLRGISRLVGNQLRPVAPRRVVP